MPDSTHTVTKKRLDTEQVRVASMPNAAIAIAARASAKALAESDIITNYSRMTAPISSASIQTQVSPKAIESRRQIERVKSVLALEEVKQNREYLDGVKTTIALLQGLSLGPVPVPVASWCSGKGASLFFEADDFYGDLEIYGNTVEYYLQSGAFQPCHEVLESEEIEEGKFPPRLLAFLFQRFARNNAQVL